MAIPPGVVNYLPGDGEVVGRHLVEHDDVNVVAFTGISHLYDSLSTFFMWDNPIENSSDVSISRPRIR